MRNLKILNNFVNNKINLKQIECATLTCQSSQYQSIVISDLKIYLTNVKTGEIKLLLDITELIPNEVNIQILDLIHFTIEGILLCCLSNGDIIKYDMESKQFVDVCTIVPQGIKAVKVSPDNELLVFVTTDNNVHLTDCRLDVLSMASLSSEQFGAGELINVGWGKKETQFHGSEGKEAAKTKVFTQDINYDIEECNNCTITWRGDSSLFAVGYFQDSIYMFKVFDREGILQFTSEKQPGLECHFSWRPSGNLIATSQQFPNKYVIAFFEKNGLKHGGFDLPFKKSETNIKKICWSSDSEVLCIWYLDTLSNKSFIYLYTVNNYHWYLKYSLVFVNDIASIEWDESNASGCGKLLHVFFTNGEYSNYNFIWCTDASKGKTLNDKALVGVIDGNNLLLTSFRKAIIPPPMAEWTLKVDSNIIQVIFGPPHNVDSTDVDSNHFALLKDNSTIEFYKINMENKIDFLWKYSLKEHIDEYIKNNTSIITQLAWVSENYIIGICSDTNTSLIMTIGFVMENTSIKDVKITPTDEQLISLCHFESDNVLFQTDTGKLIKYSLSNDQITNLAYDFPEPCFDIDVSYKDNNICVYGLTTRNRFYINGQEFINGVNSFYVHSDFLLLTTLTHQLLCCPISNNMSTSVCSFTDNKNKSSSASSRQVERGSKIVTAVSCDSRVILQLPRGNLEALQPRALSLKMIGNYLDTCQYYKAFDLMRKQRINLNLLYDHDREKFIENIENFIVQINNVSWISLFILDIADLDVTLTMYSNSYSDRTEETQCVDKIKMVCQLMRSSLEKLNENNKYILPIITTYVKTNNLQDLEKALLLIKKLNNQNVNVAVSADDAMKYLLYMVNVNILYDTALGLYDFDLVMYVASKSQKDPKEYVPFLNNLKTMEENYRHFTIDDFLKRHESALKHLIMCGEEKNTELLTYIRKHHLYKAALNIIDANDSRYGAISEIFANYLMCLKKYKEAGIIYMRCKNFDKALNAFKEACDWSSVVYLIETFDLNSTATKEIKTKLLLNLKERKQYKDVLELLLFYGEASPSELIDCCFEGHMYKKVISVCAKLKKSDVMDTLVKPFAMNHHSSLLSMIIQNEEQFIKQKMRLLVVRKTKKEREEMGDEALDDCDLYSDTSSIMASSATRSSSRTFCSSKNRRKHERKLMSLKEGSKFEDIALLRSLHNLISNTFALRKDVSELCFLLQWLNEDEKMINLQNSLEKVLLQMNNSLSEIWTPDLWTEIHKENPDDMSNKNYLLEVMSSLEHHLKVPPVIQQLDWKIEPLN